MVGESELKVLLIKRETMAHQAARLLREAMQWQVALRAGARV